MQMVKETKNRSVGIDLLKIMAIIMICLAHAGMGLSRADYSVYCSFSFSNAIISLLTLAGDGGVALFIICSAYLLLDKKRPTYSKILQILIDEFIISVLFLGIYLLAGYSISKQAIVDSFFPTFTLRNWFILSYLLFYLCFPGLNWLIKKLKDKWIFIICMIIMVIYLAMQFICKGNDEIVIIAFIGIYFFMYLLKKNQNHPLIKQPKNSLSVFLIFMFIYTFIILVFFSLCFVYPELQDYERMVEFVSLVPLLIGFCFLFMTLKDCSFKSIRLNNAINYVSGMSLLIYLFHENYFFRRYTRVVILKGFIESSGTNLVLLYFLFMGFIHFVFGVVMSFIYKNSIQRLTDPLSKKITLLITNIFTSVKSRFKKN